LIARRCAAFRRPSPGTTIDNVSPVRPTVQVVGRRMDAEHYRLRDFLTRTAQPYEWYEAGSADADLLLECLGLVDAPLPVLVDGDRSFASATLPPARARAPRRRLETGGKQDAPDGAGRDAQAELEQLAHDPRVAPI
jgi:hypothetical protein